MFIDNPSKEVGMYCHVQPFYLNSKSPSHCLCVFFCSQSAKDPVEYLTCSLAILIIWASVLNSGKGKTNYNFSVSSCLTSSFLGNGNQVCSRFGRRGLSGSLLFLCISGLGLQVVSLALGAADSKCWISVSELVLVLIWIHTNGCRVTNTVLCTVR